MLSSLNVAAMILNFQFVIRAGQVVEGLAKHSAYEKSVPICSF